MFLRKSTQQKYFFKLFFLILISCILYPNISKAQIRSDFLLSDQGSPFDFKLDDNGFFHFVWGDEQYYCLLDSLGNKIRDPVFITANSDAPYITVNSQYVMIVWSRTDAYGSYIHAQLLTIQGELVGDNLRIDDGYGEDIEYGPRADFINDTTAIIVWSGHGRDVKESGAYGQFVSTSSQLIGGNILLSDHGEEKVGTGNARVMCSRESDGFIVVWRDDYLEENNIYGRLFEADATPKGSSFLITGDPELDGVGYSVADIDTCGNFAVVFQGKKDSQWQTYWRWFDKNGMPFGPVELVIEEDDSVEYGSGINLAVDRDGKSVVVWEQFENGYQKNFAQRFLPDRTPIGNNFRISVVDDTVTQYDAEIDFYNDKIFSGWNQVKGSDYQIWGNILDFNDPFSDVVNEPVVGPIDFTLYQNYPNPFNPNTTITYEIKQREHIHMAVFNMLGEHIITLIDKEVMPGHYETVWNSTNEKGGDVPQGLYLIRLNIGTVMQTIKMLLIR